jgi:hypothetical protein
MGVPGAICSANGRLVYLKPGENAPISGAETWMVVEADRSGLFFGTGSGVKPSGETVFYASLSENDVSLSAAVSAATTWSAEHAVTTVYIQATPEQNDA